MQVTITIRNENDLRVMREFFEQKRLLLSSELAITDSVLLQLDGKLPTIPYVNRLSEIVGQMPDMPLPEKEKTPQERAWETRKKNAKKKEREKEKKESLPSYNLFQEREEDENESPESIVVEPSVYATLKENRERKPHVPSMSRIPFNHKWITELNLSPAPYAGKTRKKVKRPIIREGYINWRTNIMNLLAKSERPLNLNEIGNELTSRIPALQDKSADQLKSVASANLAMMSAEGVLDRYKDDKNRLYYVLSEEIETV